MSVQTILEEFDRLDSSEQSELIDFLLGRSASHARSVSQFITELRKRNGLSCPRCGCVEGIRKAGFTTYGIQRYKCATCGRGFIASSGTIASGSTKSLRVWKEFFRCMASGLSCRKTARICGIHYTTAFRWRHAVLDAVREESKPSSLDGIVEADETFFRLSFKGSKRLRDVADRAPHRRGGDVSSRGLSSNQVCVPTVLSRSGRSFAKAGCLGAVSVEALSYALQGAVASGATICTDSAGAYKRFSEANGIVHIRMNGKQSRIGIYNLQRINGLHSCLKRFMAPFNGVSTKYLNNYLAWNDALRNSRKEGSGAAGHLMDVSFGAFSKMNSRGYMRREPVPVVNPEAFRRDVA